MKTLLFLFTCLTIGNGNAWAYSQSDDLLDAGVSSISDVTVPSYSGTSSLGGLPVGTLIYDIGTGNFKGKGSSGSWVQLSPGTASYDSRTSSVFTPSGSASDKWLNLTDNRVILDAGKWLVTGAITFSQSGSPAPAYSLVKAQWSSTNPSSETASDPTAQTVQGGLTSAYLRGNAAGDPLVLVMPAIRVNIAADDTSVYLVPYATMSGTSSNARITTYVYAEQLE